VFDFIKKKEIDFIVCKKLKMRGLKLKQRKNDNHFILFFKNVISTLVLFLSSFSFFFKPLIIIFFNFILKCFVD